MIPKMLYRTMKLWHHSNTFLVMLLALLAAVGLAMADGGCGVLLSGRFLALLPLFAGLVPFVAFVSDDEEDEADDTAKTIVAMPAWMSEELQKEKARIEAERAAQSAETAPAASEEAAPAAVEADAPVEAGTGSEPDAAPASEASAAPEPEPIPEPDLDEAPEIAQTMAFNPAEAAAFRDMAQKSVAKATEEPKAPTELEAPLEPEPEPVPEFEAPTPAQTMAFDPAEAAAFRAEAEVEESPAAPEEDMGMAATLMFDAREAGFDKLVMEEAAPTEAPSPAAEGTPEEDLESDETGAYTAEDVARLKGMVGKDRAVEPEDDAMAGTMAYMPAVSQEMAEDSEAAPEAVDDGGARTMAYMPAVDGSESTMAYSPEDKQRILEAMQTGKSPAEAMEAVGSTQAYSPEQSAALREAFELLDQARSGAKGDSGLQAEAKELLESAHQTDPGILREQAQDLLSRTGEIKVPASAPVAASTSPSLSEDLSAVGKGGMGTVPLIIILLLLLALAGGATAFILHFLGVIDLPVDLPQLDLFKE